MLEYYAADPKQHYLLKPDICVTVIASKKRIHTIGGIPGSKMNNQNMKNMN
ncbi:MAG: hypothetical protein Q4A63_01445 [Butyricicoccus pullicaecorum]|nr:hypothetical protein [Butyricicoccus pullicaecorum]MDO4668461.1 hypothetical protein [Butyricicoccus pullicaecorum]